MELNKFLYQQRQKEKHQAKQARASAIELKEMRFPKFILCDNMEDNGIEEKRAKNFQRLIIETSKKYPKKDFQIIYTTSYIPNEYNNSTYCIGEYYSNENNNKTLNI